MRYQVLIGRPGKAGYEPGDVTIQVDDAPDEQTAVLLAGVQIGERMPFGWAGPRVVKSVISEAEHAASSSRQ